MRRLQAFLAIVIVISAGLFAVQPARADIAPPDVPPGSSLLPGAENTQVQMVSEQVLLDVLSNPPGASAGQARTTAVFKMRNLGAAAETLAVRFPLTFWNGASDGFSNYPEIRDLKAYVNDKAVPTRRLVESSPYDTWEGRAIPWAAFDVLFPPGQDVALKVVYTADAQGDYPGANVKLVAFRYVLETGSGWAGNIELAEVIVRLPYPASPENVMLSGHTGYSSTSPGAELSGSEVRWTLRDFEPDREANLEVTIVQPQHWLRILQERQNVVKNPQDGEAWGRLGKANKEALLFRRDIRDDAGGAALYLEGRQAYERSLALLPDDALWHLGYADLLWLHFLYRQYWVGSGPYDYEELRLALLSLERAKELQPGLERVDELLDWIAGSVPEALTRTGSGYDYLLLTATPAPPTPEPSPTSPPTVTAPPSPTLASTADEAQVTSSPSATVPTAGQTRQPEPTRPGPTAQPPSPTAVPSRGPCAAGALPVLLPLAGLLLIRRRGKPLSGR